MKTFIMILAMGFALAGFTPAFAGPGSESDKATEASPPDGPTDKSKDDEKSSTGPTVPETAPDDEAK